MVRRAYNLAVRLQRRGRRLLDRSDVKVAPYLGHDFAYPTDSQIGRHIARTGEWDSILRRLVAVAFPDSAPMICEVGSNIGASLLQMLAAKPQARVMAIEPADNFRQLLLRNLATAGYPNVRVVAAFVGASAGNALLHLNETSASAVQQTYADHESRGIQVVDVTTLDTLLNGETCVDFIKIDTDGLDFDVLNGARKTLERCLPLVFFELAPDLAPRWRQGLVELAAHGYHPWICVSPGQDSRLLGTTDDPESAEAWARQAGYCDVIAWNSQDAQSVTRFSRLERELWARAS